MLINMILLSFPRLRQFLSLFRSHDTAWCGVCRGVELLRHIESDSEIEWLSGIEYISDQYQ